MPRGRDDMQVNVAGLRRNIKNLAHNYSDAQVKVREATSNDPWGPSSTLMAEIADLTYNVMAFTEIMQMIWKRLNDHGKNWRHVYKALVLLEYLLKTGSDRVALQCKENIYAIQTLKDFQYMEEGKDQGLNVREKAKQLVILLKDEERLKSERERAMKAKQRFAQTASGFGSDGALDTPSSPVYPQLSSESAEWTGGRESELARPLTAGEEELQLQLALAMSREEAEREEKRRRSDDVRLQLALSQSQQDFQIQEYIRQEYMRQRFSSISSIAEHSWFKCTPLLSRSNPFWQEIFKKWLAKWPDEGRKRPDEVRKWPNEVRERQSQKSCWLVGCFHCRHQNVQLPEAQPAEPQSHLLDLLDVNLSGTAAAAPAPDPWHLPMQPPRQDTGADAWSGVGSPARDPWAPAAPPDPWAPTAAPPTYTRSLLENESPVSVLSSPSSNELEQFDALSQRRNHNHNNNHNHNPEPEPFDLSLLDNSLKPSPALHTGAVKKSPSSFLGENSSLVNLERLLQPPAVEPQAHLNPFADPPALQPAKLSINELKQQQMGLTGLTFPSSSPSFGAPPAPPVGGAAGADPWAPAPAPVPAPRGASPWSPQNQRHTPNPFLS